jgi:hypothetical protein
MKLVVLADGQAERRVDRCGSDITVVNPGLRKTMGGKISSACCANTVAGRACTHAKGNRRQSGGTASFVRPSRVGVNRKSRYAERCMLNPSNGTVMNCDTAALSQSVGAPLIAMYLRLHLSTRTKL